jgi:hypothetical protein
MYQYIGTVVFPACVVFELEVSRTKMRVVSRSLLQPSHSSSSYLLTAFMASSRESPPGDIYRAWLDQVSVCVSSELTGASVDSRISGGGIVDRRLPFDPQTWSLVQKFRDRRRTRCISFHTLSRRSSSSTAAAPFSISDISLGFRIASALCLSNAAVKSRCWS